MLGANQGTLTAWLRGSRTIQLTLDEQKLLSSRNLFPVADKPFTHLECLFVINTEIEQGITQLIFLALCTQ